MATNDEKTAIHLKLLTDISDNMEVDSREYESFIEHMKHFIPKGVLASKNTFLKKLEAMAGKGKLGVGNYEHLKKIANDSDNGEILEMISEAEQKLKTIQTKAVPEAIPSSPCVLQETKNTEEVIYDRKSHVRNHKAGAEDDGGPSISKNRKLEAVQLFTERGGRQCYATEGKKGMLLILNSFENRTATQDDVNNLRMFFKGTLGFDIQDPRKHVETDLTTEQTTRCLQSARDILNGGLPNTYYCFICVILSHGIKDYIKTKDGMLKVEDIRMYFSNENMPNFAGRPKLFFVQSARGLDITSSTEVHEYDDATQQEEETTEDKSDVKTIKIPNEADTIMAYPTTTGNRSFRRVKGFRTGTWFIIECMDVFSKEWQHRHVEDMLITVRENVALNWSTADGAKQMPCVWSTMTNRLYLAKGIKGMLLILNSFENRATTQDDVNKLRMFFKGTLGFDIHDPRKQTKEDLTTEETTRCLQGARDILNGDLSKSYYCFICVILSSGSKDYIKTKDGMLKVEDIRMYFSNENMPNFAGRPKLFFVQSCRGTDITSSTEFREYDDATKQHEETTEDKSDVKTIKIPNEADTLMAYPTTTGNRSFRRVKGQRTGSWFIIECMEVFSKKWQHHHVEDMLVTVREKVALDWSGADGAKQMPCVWSTMTKRLYLAKASIPDAILSSSGAVEVTQTSEQDADLKLIGEQIYYDPNKIIGTGSMSVVYEGRYGVKQIKRIAVKTILCADNEEAINRYREITTITTLIEPARDPNIVDFIHSYTDVEKLHIALELGKGTLVDYVKERNASWRTKLTGLNVNRGISEGLNYIHNKGIVHRDLKPPNIFIVERNDTDLKAVIGDFGSAKATNGSMYSLTGRTGSSGFIAPEVYTAMYQDRSVLVGSLCNRKSDIFSTGLLLYYTISLGDNAFGHELTAQMAIQQKTPPTFDKIDQIRNSFAHQSLIECMLKSQPEERPSAKTVLSHPANWSDIQILNYLTKKSDEFENMITTDPSNTTILEDPMLIPNGNWMNNLPPCTQTYLKAYKVNRRSPPLYKGKETSIRSLLRVIRNTNSHYQGYPQNVQLELVDYPEGHVDLWLRVCPKLLMHVVEKLGAQ